MPTIRTESARINLRTSPEAKALIERAGAIMGSTVSPAFYARYGFTRMQDQPLSLYLTTAMIRQALGASH